MYQSMVKTVQAILQEQILMNLQKQQQKQLKQLAEQKKEKRSLS